MVKIQSDLINLWQLRFFLYKIQDFNLLWQSVNDTGYGQLILTEPCLSAANDMFDTCVFSGCVHNLFYRTVTAVHLMQSDEKNIEQL